MADPTKPMAITRTVKLDMANAQREFCLAIGAPEDADVSGMWDEVIVTWTEVLPPLPLAREQAA